MSDSGSGDSINLDMIDFNRSGSDPSNGDLYEPSSVLRRVRDTLGQTDELLGKARYFLRKHPEHPEHPNVKISEHQEHPRIRSSEHPEHSKVKISEHPEHQNVKSSEHPEHTKVSSSENLIEPGNPKHQSVVSSTEYRKGKIMSEQTSNPTEKPKSGVTLETAMRIVPNFDGSNSEEAYRFIRACDFAMRIIDSGQRDTLVQGLLTKLSGRALRSVRYKDIISYQEFRKNIVEISDIEREKVQEYYEKMEQLLHDLIDATLEGGDYNNGKDIDRLLHNQVLYAFISGLPESYHILLKARAPKKLSEALVYALEEETEDNLAKKTQKLFSHPKTSKDQQPQSSKDTVKKEGHELEECRKRQWVNSKKQQTEKTTTERPNMGNGEGANASSARSVQQVQSAVLIQLRMEQINVEFQVVHDNFPIREAGILGTPFFRDNGININFRTSSLSIENPEYSENSENPENLENPEPPEKCQDLFHLEGEALPSTTAIQYEIKVPEKAAPVNIRPYRLPYAHRQVIVEQIGKLEKDKIIQPSESPWNASLVVVPKKPDADGKPQFRVCVDFRRLNQLTIGDAFPIPQIDEILDQL
ncbi:hypothetical protein QTP88_026965 [Uroleucon formosanum]